MWYRIVLHPLARMNYQPWVKSIFSMNCLNKIIQVHNRHHFYKINLTYQQPCILDSDCLWYHKISHLYNQYAFYTTRLLFYQYIFLLNIFCYGNQDRSGNPSQDIDYLCQKIYLNQCILLHILKLDFRPGFKLDHHPKSLMVLHQLNVKH